MNQANQSDSVRKTNTITLQELFKKLRIKLITVHEEYLKY